MARRTQISREIILSTAFQMLVRDGYSSINITSLAREIGCSTQPIAWHFGSMDGLRDALLRHSLEYIRNHFALSGDSTTSMLLEIQQRYTDLAFNSPNLYKYLYMTDHNREQTDELLQSLRFPNYEEILCSLQQEYGVSKHAAQRYLLDVQLYVHGIASCAVANIPVSFKENVISMIRDANETFLEKMIKTN
mgnify:CR=1 FL=1